MKKFLFKMNMAIIAGMVATPAFAANANGLCGLISEMQSIFRMLRTLAFVGAAFIIAGWAWGYISSGKAELKDLQGKGIGMLVGFALLFALGIVMQALMSQGVLDSIGCRAELISGWNKAI